jgi:hypothetical protein
MQDKTTMQEIGSRLQPPTRERRRLEDQFGSIALPALKAALDAAKAVSPPPKQMSASLPEKFRDFEEQS